MALIICPECGTQVSNIAEQCPRCGYPISAYLNARTANRRTTAGNANATNGSTPSQGGVFYAPVARVEPDNGQHYVDRYPQTYAPYPRQQADATSDWKRLLPWFLVPFLVIAILVSLGIYFVPGLLSTTTYLRADTENINALRPAAEYKISLHSDGKTYKLAHAPAWATTKLKDSLLVCKISENTTHADRADSIVVTNGKLRMLIKVQQTGAASFLRVDDNSVHFSKDGGERTIHVESDGANITLQNSVSSVQVHYVNGELHISAPPNRERAKSGSITISADGQTATVYVKVEGGDRFDEMARSSRSAVFRIENVVYNCSYPAYLALYFSAVDCHRGRAVQYSDEGSRCYAKEIFDFSAQDDNLYLSNGSNICGGHIGSRVFNIGSFLSGNSNSFQGYTNSISSCTFSYESWKKAPTWDDRNIVGNIQ